MAKDSGVHAFSGRHSALLDGVTNLRHFFGGDGSKDESDEFSQASIRMGDVNPLSSKRVATQKSFSPSNPEPFVRVFTNS